MSKNGFASIFLALIMLGIFALPALAVPPDPMEIPFNPSYEVADCGTFQVMNHEESTLRLTFFYDGEGNLVRVNQYWSGTDYLTHSETEKSIASNFTNHAVIDLTTSTVRQGGIFWHVTVPHQGPVFFETGQYVILDIEDPEPDITFHGVSNLDEEALCSLLAD